MDTLTCRDNHYLSLSSFLFFSPIPSPTDTVNSSHPHLVRSQNFHWTEIKANTPCASPTPSSSPPSSSSSTSPPPSLSLHLPPLSRARKVAATQSPPLRSWVQSPSLHVSTPMPKKWKDTWKREVKEEERWGGKKSEASKAGRGRKGEDGGGRQGKAGKAKSSPTSGDIGSEGGKKGRSTAVPRRNGAGFQPSRGKRKKSSEAPCPPSVPPSLPPTPVKLGQRSTPSPAASLLDRAQVLPARVPGSNHPSSPSSGASFLPSKPDFSSHDLDGPGEFPIPSSSLPPKKRGRPRSPPKARMMWDVAAEHTLLRAACRPGNFCLRL